MRKIEEIVREIVFYSGDSINEEIIKNYVNELSEIVKNNTFYSVSLYTDTPELIDYSHCNIISDLTISKIK